MAGRLVGAGRAGARTVRRRLRSRVVATALLVAVAVTAGISCRDEGHARVRVAGGSPELGARAIRKYGCGSCHTIPGIKGADALVAPPLIHWSRRTYIAGRLVNNPAHLARWIQAPSEVEPGTAMPDLGVSPEEAANIAAYLLDID